MMLKLTSYKNIFKPSFFAQLKDAIKLIDGIITISFFFKPNDSIARWIADVPLFTHDTNLLPK